VKGFRAPALKTAWHSRLHWRIAVAFVVIIAGVLAAQGGVFLWMLERSARAREPGVTRALSAMLAARLEANPHVDLGHYVATAKPGEHVFVIMTSGVVRGSRTPADRIVQSVIADLNRPGGSMPATWENSVYRAAPIIVGGKTVGVLGIVPPTTLEAYGPAMFAVGALLLVAGAVIASLVIVGPVRRRARDLEEAAARVGSGDLAARAREAGGDELAQLARTFNRMAAQLAGHAAELEASDRARRQLIADVSHELMTPLTTVIGNIETLMMSEVRLDESRRDKFLTVTLREARRLERLIGDLLDAARLEAGGGDLEFKNVPVRDLFDLVTAHHEHECLARGIKMVQTVAAGAESLLGDPFRLEQALVNLTTNALRHSPDGSRIELASAKTAEGAVALTVTDHGRGIAAEDLPLIFDRFYKARTPSGIPQDGGSGLGLSIVKAIVSRHGGKVSATSSLGQGTTVRLEVPAGPQAAAAVA
jgi:signal transduction histidine kinase